jgi:hypothetical protein
VEEIGREENYTPFSFTVMAQGKLRTRKRVWLPIIWLNQKKYQKEKL